MFKATELNWIELSVTSMQLCCTDSTKRTNWTAVCWCHLPYLIQYISKKAEYRV